MKYIKLYHGELVKVDNDDFDKLNQYKWHLCAYGYAERSKYFPESQKSIQVKMHREIMGFPKDLEVDHINQDRLDNRKENLRLVTKSQNGMNRGPTKKNKSGYKGIHWDEINKKWSVHVNANKKMVFFGRYKSLKEAIIACNKARSVYHGEYATVVK